jgi:hypothetical protein
MPALARGHDGADACSKVHAEQDSRLVAFEIDQVKRTG